MTDHTLSDSGSRFQVDKLSVPGEDDGKAGSSDDFLSPSQCTVQGNTYLTQYMKSFHNYTQEALPREALYDPDARWKPVRPSVHKLIDGTFVPEQPPMEDDEDPTQKKKGKVIKFGWIQGVYMRCLLNIWGVMLFLRLSWVIGEAGVGLGLAIMLVSNIVTIITAISMSAVSTNGKIRAGGIYYMISRSLGPEFGGSIGLMFTLSNSVACAMYVVGFCESLLDLLEYVGVPKPIIDGGVNDTRIIGAGTLVVLLIIAFVGMDWVTRCQMVLLVVLIAAQIDYFVGCIIGPQNDEERAKGMAGFGENVLNENWGPHWKDDAGTEQSFFTVFAVFFPAVTGIVAGANLSGDLKDPSTAIPKGTLLAIFTTLITYIVYAFFFGATMNREASGNMDDFNIHKNYTSGCVTEDNNCEWGLYNAQAMTVASAWDGLIYAGCFAATLSSAIASLVGAPRVLQALAADKLYPYVFFFAKGYGANNDPIRGYILCFIIALACVAIGDVNVVATITTTIFLTAYGLINFSVFHASITKSPGWRPAFKYYNAWVSLFGTLMCIAVMFLINWWLSLITIAIVAVLYLMCIYFKPNVNWGSSTQAQSYISALRSAQDLLGVEEHVKNYRPQVLVLGGRAHTRPPLLDFGNLLTKNISLMVVANVEKPGLSQRERQALMKQAYASLSKQKVRAFFNLIEEDALDKGAKAMYQLTGIGKLRPNMVLMGFKGNWKNSPRDEIKSYFMTIHDALDAYLAIGILRVQEGLDYSNVIETFGGQVNPTFQIDEPSAKKIDSSSSSSSDDESSSDDTPPMSSSIENAPPKKKKAMFRKQKVSVSQRYRGPGGVALSRDILNNVSRFQKKQDHGYIDVWWLYDDGGLTLLLPYILTTRKQYEKCKLRIFSIANKKEELDMEQRNMASLLSKFRIEYSDVIIVPDIGKRAEPETQREFDNIIHKFKSSGDDGVNDAELQAHKEKTNRHLRLRELLLNQSRVASLIVMTLPMPRKGSVSPYLYMAWLETITKGMPPFLLVRGNQESVLTFYS